MDTSTRQQRKERKIRALRSKIGVTCPDASTRKDAEARRNRAIRERKRGTEKICPPYMVVGADPGSIPA
jgi:hypothetical protein